VLNHALQVVEVAPLRAALQRFQPLSGDSQRIRYGDADSARAHIEPQYPPGRKRSLAPDLGCNIS
jgi:hypothetical protein